MQKMIWIAAITLAAVMAAANADDKITPKVNDALAFAPPGSVKFYGWIGEAMATCKTGRMYAQSLPDLINPFAVREEDRMWRGEVLGKWFTSAALAYRYDGDPKLRDIGHEG